MSETLYWIVFLSGLVPWQACWQGNAGTSLRHALAWGFAAWTAWGVASALNADPIVPLALTAAAGVAVLGARRPGVAAWNAVVAGLLLVLLLPLAETTLLGTSPTLDGPRWLFLAGTLFVGLVNYLPTRQSPTAVALGMVAAVEMGVLAGNEHWAAARPLTRTLVAFLPWLAWAVAATAPPAPSQFDRTWRLFRDRYGLVWGQRLREQFNNAARHAGWPVVLRWTGLRLLPGAPPPDEAVQEALLATLDALLKRFEPPPDSPA
jgi:hypothetical protein